jgi:hypothetical protein
MKSISLKISVFFISLTIAISGCIKEDFDTPPVKTLIFFESFNDTLGSFTAYSVTGAQVWAPAVYSGTTYANMTGFSGGSYNANEDWLISKAINFDTYNSETLSFESATKYGIATDTSLKVFYSTNYTGTGDPTTAIWTRLNNIPLSTGNFTWVKTGNIDLSGIAGSNVFIAFKYLCTTSNVPTWEITKVKLNGFLN